MNRFLLAVSVFAVLLSGCDKEPDVTTQELVDLLNIKSCTVQLPDDIQAEDYVEVVLQNADGELVCGFGSMGNKPKERLKVFFWDSPGDFRYQVAIKNESGLIRGSLNNEFRVKGSNFITSYTDSSKVLEPGEFFMKSGTKVTPKPHLEGDEYGMTLRIVKAVIQSPKNDDYTNGNQGS